MSVCERKCEELHVMETDAWPRLLVTVGLQMWVGDSGLGTLQHAEVDSSMHCKKNNLVSYSVLKRLINLFPAFSWLKYHFLDRKTKTASETNCVISPQPLPLCHFKQNQISKLYMRLNSLLIWTFFSVWGIIYVFVSLSYVHVAMCVFDFFPALFYTVSFLACPCQGYAGQLGTGQDAYGEQ